MASIRVGYFRFLLLFSLLTCGGCAVPGLWYAPQGDGVLTKTGGIANRYDVLKIDLGSNAWLYVSAEAGSFSSDIYVYVALHVPEHKWVQLATNTIELSHSDNKLTKTAVIDQLDSNMGTETGIDYKTYQPLQKLEGGPKYAREFYRYIPVKDFRPKQFQLKMPEFVVNGNTVDIPPITFRLHRGIVLYEQLQ